MSKNPMTRTQWRYFQRRRQAERQAAEEAAEKNAANKASIGKKYMVKVDTNTKERVREFISRPNVKCSEEVTDDFKSDCEESLNILVNVVSILPAEYDCLTEVEDSEDVNAEEMALHKPTCYFVMNNGSVENQDAFFEKPSMAMKSHLKPLLI